MTFGLYEVIGAAEYRGHPTGTVFEARLDRAAEVRAIRRRSIALIDRVEPRLEPGSWELPPGWADDTQVKPRSRKAPLSLGG